MDTPDSVYTRRKKLSIYWYNKASDLRGSAGALWASMDDKCSKEITEELGMGKGFSMAIATYPVYLMLCGMALELLYKAITIAKGGEPNTNSHKLNDLALDAGVEIKEKQIGLLYILSESIYWDGRYPVSKKQGDFDNLNNLVFENLYDKVENSPFRKPNNALSWEAFNGELWNNAFDVYWQYHS